MITAQKKARLKRAKIWHDLKASQCTVRSKPMEIRHGKGKRCFRPRDKELNNRRPDNNKQLSVCKQCARTESAASKDKELWALKTASVGRL